MWFQFNYFTIQSNVEGAFILYSYDAISVLYFLKVKETILFLSTGLHYFKYLISDCVIMLTSHYRTPLIGYFVSPL